MLILQAFSQETTSPVVNKPVRTFQSVYIKKITSQEKKQYQDQLAVQYKKPDKQNSRDLTYITFSGTTGAIPDGGPEECFTCDVTGLTSIDWLVSVCIDITHPNVGDLNIYLETPFANEPILELSTGNGGSGANYTNTCFTRDATVNIVDGSPPFTGDFLPEGGELQLNLVPNGEWKLCIEDTQSGNSGTLNSWELTFSAPPCHTVGYHPYEMTTLPATINCDDAPLWLVANDSSDAIGYDYPALIFQFETDEFAAYDNYVRIWDSEGVIIYESYYPISPNYVVTIYPSGPAVSPSKQYYFSMYEGTGDGGFDWLVYDGNSTAYGSGSYPVGTTGWYQPAGSYSPQGIATFSGFPTYATFDDGWGYLDPFYIHQNGGLGEYDVEYCFDNERTGDYYCQGCETQTVEIINPYDASWTTPGTICESIGIIDLDALVTGTAGGTWTGAGVTGSTFDPTGLSGDISINYTVGYSAPCNASHTQIVTVVPSPTVNAGDDGLICEGSDFGVSTATATNYASLTWSTSGTGTFTNNGTLSPTYTPGTDDITSGSVILTLTVTGNSPCGTVDDNMTLDISPEVSVYAGDDATICEGEDYTVTDATAGNYTALSWTSSGTGSFVNENTLSPTYTPGSIDLANGSVTLTLEAAGISPCPPLSDNLTLSFETPPTVSAGEDDIICSNETFTVSTATAQDYASLLWTTSGSGIFTGNGTLTPTYTPSEDDITDGSVFLTLTAVANSPCTNQSDNMELVITTQPTVYAGIDEMTCEAGGDGGVTITTAIASNYASLNWGTSGDGSFTENGTISPTYFPGTNDIILGSVNLTLTATGNTPCGSPNDDMTLTISVAPIADAGDAGTICGNETFTVSTASALNYTSLNWVSSGTGTFTDNGTITPTYTPSAGDVSLGAVTLTLTAYGYSPCPDAVDDMILTINLSATADAGNNADICEGGDFTVSTATASDYDELIWSSSGTGTFSDNGTITPTYSPSADDISAGEVILTLTATGFPPCGDAVDNMTLSIVSYPEAYAGDDVTICEGSDITITTATASNYSSLVWSSSGTGSFTDNGTLTPTYSPSPGDIETGTITLTLTAEQITPCTEPAVDNMILTINTAPMANAGENGLICMGSDFTVTTSSASSYSDLNWTTSGTGIFINNGTLYPTYTPSAEDIDAGTVNLTLNALGYDPCDDASDFMVLDISPEPEVWAGNDAIICESDEFTVTTATASDYAGLLWTTSGTGTFVNASTLTPTYTPGAEDIVAASVTLTFTAYGITPCDDVSDAMTLTINLQAAANAGEDGLICGGETFTVNTATASDYESLMWFTDGTGTFTNNGTLSPTYTPDSDDIDAGGVTLTFTAYGLTGCEDTSDDMFLTITPPPEANAGDDATMCETGDFTVSTAFAENYESLLWTTSGTGTFTANGTLTPTYAPGSEDINDGIVTLILTATGTSPCDDATDNMILNINLQANADAGEDELICGDQVLTITTASAENYASLLWSSSGTGTFTNGTTLGPTYSPSSGDITAGSVTLTLVAYAFNFCEDFNDDMILSIVAPPAANAGDDGTICETGDFTITTATSEDYESLLWTTSGTGTFTNNGTLTPTYTPGSDDIEDGFVSLTLSATGVSPCDDAVDDMLLNINLQAEADAGDDETICGDQELTISTATAENYASLLWITSGSGTFSDATTLTPTYTPGGEDIAAGEVTLTLTAYAYSFCEDVTDNMLLTIISPAYSDAGDNATICEDATLTIVTASAENYTSLEWTTSGTGTFVNNGTLTPTYIPSEDDIILGSITLTLNVTANPPCNDVSDDMQLYISPLPTADAGDDDEVCETDSYTLSGYATNYSSVVWTSDGDGTFDDPTISDAIYTPGDEDIMAGYVILHFDAQPISPCVDPATDFMSLIIGTVAVADAGEDAMICENDSYMLSGYVGNESYFQWSTSGDGVFDNLTSLDATYYPGTGDVENGEVVLTLTAWSNAPCDVEVPDDMTLSFSYNPVANAGQDGEVCENASHTLEGSAENFSSVEWQTPGDGTFDDNSVVNPTYTPGIDDIEAGSVQLTLIVYPEDPCTETDADDMVLTIVYLPEVNAGDDATICENTNYTLSGSVSYYSSILWITAGDGTFDDPTSLTPTYYQGVEDIANGYADLGISAQPISPCSTPEFDDIKLTFTPLPVVFAGGDAEICNHETYIVTDAFAVNYTGVEWTTSGDGSFINGSTLTPTYTPGDDDIVTGEVMLTLTASPLPPCNAVADEMILTIHDCTGIDDDLLNKMVIEIFPNPSKGRFIISIKGITSNLEIVITSPEGKIIFEDKISANSSDFSREIDISGNYRGIYFLRITNGKTVRVEKIMIQ
jgi:subtilisin-like proprotein convertase family protein